MKKSLIILSLFFLFMTLFQYLLAQNIDNRLGGQYDNVGFYIINSNNDTVFTCLGDGRVGIGAKYPTQFLEVVAPDGGDGILVRSPNPAGGRIHIGMAGGGEWGWVSLSDSDQNHTYIKADGAYFKGTYGNGGIPIEGGGTRMMWYPGKAAFRAGYVYSDNWDDSNIGEYSIAMGQSTTASGFNSTALGSSTLASGPGSTAMGVATGARGAYSTAMGFYASAYGNYSTAMGSWVQTLGTGSFIIGDFSTNTMLTRDGDNKFFARFDGGYELYTNSDATAGVYLNSGDISWRSLSDSTKKENFKLVDGEEILGNIAQFKLGTWNFIGQDPNKHRHYGPMAQDFFAAFGHDGIGTIGNDTTLSSADFDGINFIAIQALEKRTTELRKENELLKKEISELKNNLVRIEQLREEIAQLRSFITNTENAVNQLKEISLNQ
jgi:hypothetical protein